MARRNTALFGLCIVMLAIFLFAFFINLPEWR